jgi:predicted amidophosphoribosyltransferase
MIRTYACPQCKGKLTRASKWLGYCCEACRLAVTIVSEREVRLSPLSGSEPTMVPLAALCEIA